MSTNDIIMITILSLIVIPTVTTLLYRRFRFKYLHLRVGKEDKYIKTEHKYFYEGGLRGINRKGLLIFFSNIDSSYRWHIVDPTRKEPGKAESTFVIKFEGRYYKAIGITGLDREPCFSLEGSRGEISRIMSTGFEVVGKIVIERKDA